MRCAIVFLFLFAKAFAFEYIEYQKHNQAPITSIQIFGERCSGTNYLQALLERNFLGVNLDFRYGWKHYPCWQDSYWKVEYRDHFSSYYLDFADSDNTLFIFIVRNPYDWLKSFYNNPHNVSFRIDRSSFKAFITSTWYTEHEETIQWIMKHHKRSCTSINSKNDWICQYFLNPKLHDNLSTAFWDSDPLQMSYFPNVLALRTSRLQNFLKIAGKIANACIIQYEKLYTCPHEVLTEIAQAFNIQMKKDFTSILEYKGKGSTFIPKKYFSLSKDEQEYIQEHLDPEVEKVFGYDLFNGPK